MRSINKIMKSGSIILVTLAAFAFGQDAPEASATDTPVPVAVQMPSSEEAAPSGEVAPSEEAAPSEEVAADTDTETKEADAEESATSDEQAETDEDAAQSDVAEEAEDDADDEFAVEAAAEDVPAEVTETEETAEQETEQAARPKGNTKLGLMRLESLTGHDDLAEEMTAVTIDKLDDLGLYELYRPQDLERALDDAGIRRPGNCRDPQCVQSIARALGLRRMISGTIDMNGDKCGVKLILIDVAISHPIETVSIEGAPGVPAKNVLLTALDRLHGGGYLTDIDVFDYHGPSVNNMREFMWSTVATQGAGLFYSIINYGLGSSSGSDISLDDGAYSDKERLSGISSSSHHIPMFARPAALANAYTAVSDDAYGALYNPAGLPWATHREGAFGYQSRFGMDLIAFSYVNKAMRDIGFGQALTLVTDRDNLMTEMFFTTSAGYKYNDIPVFGPISFGASIRVIGNSVNGKSLDSPEGQAFGAGLDLGLMWELSDKIRYGLHMKDVLAVGRWKNITTDERYSEWMPTTMRMGGSYRAGYTTLLVADGQIPLYDDQPWVMAGGIEYEFFRMLALRVGLEREIMDDEDDWWKITTGCGFKFDIDKMWKWGKYMHVDLAYEYNTLELFSVLNVSLKFGF